VHLHASVITLRYFYVAVDKIQQAISTRYSTNSDEASVLRLEIIKKSVSLDTEHSQNLTSVL